ncbi:putative MFS sugar transporter [Aspergillus saccharolyticus JOP 1030-1]|uniref:MFS general substrate transporter n=1 Tax=Aspergillus saccharolyticus JOP 1030-1 TaxID=1450539 RepID=A0A318ZM09_9EURO|nr:hypothetical protein BP01DRAFT_413673 [Aspergillus saccharolyticus JOP 1030-1]PYH48576.1 hypothetical protein BP01DRAFT_413673 [Aspergillus saccharolyticus JOP 1030-1]
MGTFGLQTSAYNRLVTAFVAVGSITYGYCSSIISSTIGQPEWYTYFELPREGQHGYRSITTSAISTSNGVYSAGGAVGCLFIMCMFQAGRFICGLGIGILVTVCPMYLSEISSAFRQGWLVGYHAIFLVFGYMLAGWVGYACYFAQGQMGTFGWRFPLCLQCLSPLILLSKQSEAQSVLERLRKSPDDPDSLKESYQKRMIIGFLTQWGAEFGAPLITNNYAVILYTNLGMTGSTPLLLSAVWLTTAGIIYNLLGAWLHDRVNSRRRMYITGFIAQYAGTKNRVGNGFATFILLETAPMGFNSIGWKYYLVIICWSAFFVPVIYLIFPETARSTPEEVARNFDEQVAVRLTDATEEEKARLERDLAARFHSYHLFNTNRENQALDSPTDHQV